jgi:hypothetical protein
MKSSPFPQYIRDSGNLQAFSLAFARELWYSFFGATRYGRRFPHSSGVIFFAPNSEEKGVGI